MRPTLTLRKRPDPATQPKVDPAKVALSEMLGVRFICRDYRHICQKLVVTYMSPEQALNKHHMSANYYPSYPELSRTWIDVPLVPEAYFT